MRLFSAVRSVKFRRRSPAFTLWAFIAFFAIIALSVFLKREQNVFPEQKSVNRKDPTVFKVTGYCNCGKCCGWSRNFFGLGQSVYNYGPLKGKPKKVGLTSSGKMASRGTVAADLKQFKYGDRLYIPGYGVGRVEDIGGAIKGRHIDIWFPSHEEALRWGVKWLKIRKVLD